MTTQSSYIMDTPASTSFIQTALDFWKEILGALVLFGGIWAYAKLLHGQWKDLKLWFKHAAQAPTAVLEIKKELLLDTGISLRQAVFDLGGNLNKLTMLLNSETKWRRSILDSVDVPIFEADKDGRFMWANTALLELADLEMPQIMGNNWRNFIADQDRRSLVDGWAMAVRDCTNFRVKFRLSANGPDRWMVFNAACNKDEFGNVLGFVGKLRAIDGLTAQITT